MKEATNTIPLDITAFKTTHQLHRQNIRKKLNNLTANCQTEYSFHFINQSLPTPNIKNMQKNIFFLSAFFDVVAINEGAPQSVTGLPQWLSYVNCYHLPLQLYKIKRMCTTVTFGGQGKIKSK